MARSKRSNIWGGAALLVILAWMYNPVAGILVALASALVAYWWYRKYDIIRVATLQELMALSPSEFERAVATLLKDLGYRNVRVVGGAGDLARDISCQDARGGSIMVQCKKYGQHRSVNSPDVQRFIGMMMTEHRASSGIYVTTSELTEPALGLCRKHQIEVWDGNRLADLLNQARRRQIQEKELVVSSRRRLS